MAKKNLNTNSEPLEKQIDKYSKTVISFWEKYENNPTQIRTLEKSHDSLLPKLMSGEVRV